MTKTRKSVTNRVKVTKNGKMTRRKMGLGHFRSKKSSREMHRKEPGSGTSVSKVDGKMFTKKYGIRF
jgi:ribosomal protein L35